VTDVKRIRGPRSQLLLGIGTRSPVQCQRPWPVLVLVLRWQLIVAVALGVLAELGGLGSRQVSGNLANTRGHRRRYFVDNNETEVADVRSGTLAGVARYVLDPTNANRLWEVTEQLLS